MIRIMRGVEFLGAALRRAARREHHGVVVHERAQRPEVPGRGGAASAWIGATQFILAGAVSALVGLGGEETAVPLALTMLVGSVGALAALRVAGRTPA